MKHWISMVFAAAFCLCSSRVSADFTIPVTKTDDSGPGSLRDAIVAAHAQPDETVLIYFSTSTFPPESTIQLLDALPTLTKRRVYIDGQGLTPRIVAPVGGTTGLFNTSPALETLSLAGLRLEGGRSSSGGACIAAGRSNVNDPVLVVTISDSELSDCRAVADGAANTAGGAVAVRNLRAILTVRNSLFSNNRVSNGVNGSANGSGGAIEFLGEYLTVENSQFLDNDVQMVQGNGGAINTANALKRQVVRDSVLSGNSVLGESAVAYGGAVQASCFQDCEVFIERNFFSDNTARSGGAIYLRRGNVGDRIAAFVANNTFHANQASESGGGLRLSDTVLQMIFNTFEGNASPDGAHLSLRSAQPELVQHNALGASSGGVPCQISATTSSALLSGYNALLDPSCAQKLQPGATLLPTLGTYMLDYAQAMPVIAYASDGPLVDTGVAGTACFDLDARRTVRPLDGDRDGEARCDIGAYEHPVPISPRVFADSFER